MPKSPVTGDIWAYAHGERLNAHLKRGPNSMENGEWSDPTGRRLRILLEEVGEVAREFNDAEIENRDVDAFNLFNELIQVTAMAGAWADKILQEWRDA